jgi:hypothetical protein
MSIELAPKEQIAPFVSTLSELVGAYENHNQAKTATKSLKDLELGVVYDPRLAAGRMMLVLQERKTATETTARKTIRLELFANRFKVISYITELTVEDILQNQIEDIRAQSEPLDYEKGYGHVVDTFDDLDPRLYEAEQKIDEAEKSPSAAELTEIQNGLKVLIQNPNDSSQANEILSKFLTKQFE